ncbi:MAG TPA: sporulation integral membrane protein YlbJ [Desulfotomaculum sp.]|nr:MAG: Sporulation integral membrane protein YlbJ [Desulfotomaculum sp. 46_80]KUK85308.1 MAG: Sporulation integral membrane protein YlbJ [Desulfofundulus kuznetsovii]HAG10564.1 sporulation integral membrane protein YlbJ [Desulfotomaculum sp.]HBY03455.1 sporulation integral membrane protein YlbJ [Desulfotomaculum sp.]
MWVLFILLLLLISLIVFKKYLFFLINDSRRREQFFWLICIITLALGMIIQPGTVYQGAMTGVSLWFNIVFPSLLPFLIISDLLLSFGMVHFLGALMEPLMRPLFNVPGCGSFVLAVGYTSGCPIGAMITARLRSQRLCTRIEAERLVSFTNNSSPLFMLVAVAVGMLNNPELGPVIAAAHYTSNLTLGFVLRFYGKNDPELITAPIKEGSPLTRAFSELFRIYRQENRSPGKIMGAAVKNSISSLLNIGGFIIIFAVLIQLLKQAGFIDFIAGKLGLILIPLGFSSSVLPALTSGLIEMTVGAKLASASEASLLQQLTVIAIILAWSGISIHAQVASVISETDIRMKLFVLTRFAHALLAAIYTNFFFRLVSPAARAALTQQAQNSSLSLWTFLPLLLAVCGLILVAFLTGSAIICLCKKLFFRNR